MDIIHKKFDRPVKKHKDGAGADMAAVENVQPNREDEPISIGYSISGGTERDVQILRRKLDDIKAKSKQKQEHLNGIREKFKEVIKLEKEMQNKPSGPVSGAGAAKKRGKIDASNP